jgi:ribokinase
VRRVCVIGSANVDHALALPRLPRAGETVSGGTLLVNFGGKGANQAVAARRLGSEVRMIGCVGEDGDGRAVRERLRGLGIGVEGLLGTPEAATGMALILVDPAGQNLIGVAPGANHRLTVAMARPQAGSIRWADVLVCQLETPLEVVAWALAEARGQGIATILNPAPVRDLPDEVLARVSYLTPNAGEAGALAGMAVADVASARAAAERLLGRGAGAVVVTLGAEGALACDGGRAVHFPAFPVHAVDTTAAGDAFTGGLAVGLAAGGRLEEAIPLAQAAAALACTRRGAQDSLPDRGEVEGFLRRLRSRPG